MFSSNIFWPHVSLLVQCISMSCVSSVICYELIEQKRIDANSDSSTTADSFTDADSCVTFVSSSYVRQ